MTRPDSNTPHDGFLRTGNAQQDAELRAAWESLGEQLATSVPALDEARLVGRLRQTLATRARVVLYRRLALAASILALVSGAWWLWSAEEQGPPVAERPAVVIEPPALIDTKQTVETKPPVDPAPQPVVPESSLAESTAKATSSWDDAWETDYETLRASIETTQWQWSAGVDRAQGLQQQIETFEQNWLNEQL